MNQAGARRFRAHYAGHGSVVERAGMQREGLCRALLPKGNPTTVGHTGRRRFAPGCDQA